MKNRKGFTLIEMLVVIAIIAILVAVIIPVVQGSTTRAAAAANAANLRSVKAEIQTIRLLEPEKFGYITAQTANNGVLTFGELTTVAPGAKALEAGGVNVPKDTQMRVSLNGDEIICTYRGYTIEMFAEIAENGTSKGAISQKDELMNKAEDLNDKYDSILENINDKYDFLTDEQIQMIQQAGDYFTDIANSQINGADSSHLLDAVDRLLGIIGGFGNLFG